MVLATAHFADPLVAHVVVEKRKKLFSVYQTFDTPEKEGAKAKATALVNEQRAKSGRKQKNAQTDDDDDDMVANPTVEMA